MSQSPSPADAAPRTLRIWPALVILGLMWLGQILPAKIDPEANNFMLLLLGTFAPMVATAALAVWWLFFSRAPSWTQRFVGLLACVGIGFAAWSMTHATMDLFVLFVFALVYLVTVWIAYLAITPGLAWTPRFVGLLLVFALSWGFWDAVRFRGTYSSFTAQFWWRWTLTSEDILAAAGSGTNRKADAGQAIHPGDWPAFRGPNRDGRLPGVQIGTDWKANPPKELWRKTVGPAWSSVAVVGEFLYTQEQVQAEELVTCYKVADGERVWTHRDTARFSETVAGPGPRATPTFHEGKLYTQGAAGRLNCLNAADGKVIWSRDIVEDSGANLPGWGFAASPLVWKGVVTTYCGAKDRALLGYDAATGKPLWQQGKGGHSYCSPHPARLHGVDQILYTTELGVTAHDPVKGTVLWDHDWAMQKGMSRVVQPAVIGETDVLIGTFFGMGTRRVKVQHEKSEEWTTVAEWTDKAMKPYFYDFVLHKGYAYGSDTGFFVCLNQETGKAKWKERIAYGNGQVLLLPDQDLILVVTETGEVALIEANTEGYKELGRFQAMKDKTWNHPVIAHGKLFVRNGEEMVCYELPPVK